MACHPGKETTKGIDLTGGKTKHFSVSYETLIPHLDKAAVHKYVDWISTASFRHHETNILEIVRNAGGRAEPAGGVAACGPSGPRMANRACRLTKRHDAASSRGSTSTCRSGVPTRNPATLHRR